MNLEQLKQAGALVSAEPVAREIVWEKTDDKGAKSEVKFDVLIKRRSFGTFEKMYSGGSARSVSAALIAETVLLGKEGNEQFTYEDAYQLDPTLAIAFVNAINDVNKIGQAPPKK